jgi:hypothetical protein
VNFDPATIDRLKVVNVTNTPEMTAWAVGTEDKNIAIVKYVAIVGDDHMESLCRSLKDRAKRVVAQIVEEQNEFLQGSQSAGENLAYLAEELRVIHVFLTEQKFALANMQVIP